MMFRDVMRLQSVVRLRSPTWSSALRTTNHRVLSSQPADAPNVSAFDSSHPALSLRLPSFGIWGANTDVGKTLVSTGLAQAFAQEQAHVLFMKPVQTGFPKDSDADIVASVLCTLPYSGSHAAVLKWGESPPDTSASEPLPFQNGSAPPTDSPWSPATVITTFAWRAPVSPHLAVKVEGRGISDASIQAATAWTLGSFASSVPQGRPGVSLVETAGGPASPGPSGSLQCNIYRPLRLPALLVGDGTLGGISTTLAAYELLRSRGFDVPGIVLVGDVGDNAGALRQHLGPSVPVWQLAALTKTEQHARERQLQRQQQQQQGGQQQGPPVPPEVRDWLRQTGGQFAALAADLRVWHEQRVAQLQQAASAARKTLWWPFTQHTSVADDKDVMVIDSRHGEDFAAFVPPAGGEQGAAITPRFDACASWWTQGIGAELHPKLVTAVLHAAGRYGHVMFPENAHQPALDVARKLLQGVGKGWASRVFYSDDGSTAVEVALKMAFRKFAVDHSLGDEDIARLRVLGLQNAYHGDTLGAMSAVPASAFNGPRQFPWYEGRGVFLEPPSVGMSKGMWRVKLPQMPTCPELAVEDLAFESRNAVFDETRDQSSLRKAYQKWIEHTLDAEASGPDRHRRLGACIVEPVLQGSGGMVLVDPLFQRTLVAACRERTIPVIFDEVFSGLWRLGRQSAAELLGCQPDIACYAKLLTGGLLPLAVTLASEDIFRAFEGPAKTDALLHGHSYTAHPMGCAAAVAALDLFADPATNPRQCRPPAFGQGGDACPIGLQGGDTQQDSSDSSSSSAAENSCCSPESPCSQPCGRLTELWDPQLLEQLSHHPVVERCHAIGTVLAAEIKADDASLGYSSTAARAVVKRMAPYGVYARPLGNVVYLMVGPTTAQERCDKLLRCLLHCLD